MTPTQYREACAALGLSIYASARAFEVSLPMAQRYASGTAAIPPKIAKLIRACLKLGTTNF